MMKLAVTMAVALLLAAPVAQAADAQQQEQNKKIVVDTNGMF